MKKYLALLAMLLPLAMLQAQITHTSQGDVDKTAATLLKRASAKINKGTVSFGVTMVNKNSEKKETARQKATVLYREGSYRVEYDHHLLLCNGTDLWHVDNDAKEVTISHPADSDEDLMNPGRLLANYNKNFRAKYIRTEQNGNAIVDLMPRKGKSYHKIRLTLVESSGTIVSLELCNYDGSRGLYLVSNFRTGVKSSNADFIFDAAKHPGLETIDMR